MYYYWSGYHYLRRRDTNRVTEHDRVEKSIPVVEHSRKPSNSILGQSLFVTKIDKIKEEILEISTFHLLVKFSVRENTPVLVTR